ncbi:hypothetical protein L208DRAFT_1399751 [Tricholoma matsutake]|nr:hypothetical protein L208DRAFT_1399751 [Tricholoma matsutake 945]
MGDPRITLPARPSSKRVAADHFDDSADEVTADSTANFEPQEVASDDDWTSPTPYLINLRSSSTKLIIRSHTYGLSGYVSAPLYCFNDCSW